MPSNRAFKCQAVERPTLAVPAKWRRAESVSTAGKRWLQQHCPPCSSAPLSWLLLFLKPFQVPQTHRELSMLALLSLQVNQARALKSEHWLKTSHPKNLRPWQTPWLPVGSSFSLISHMKRFPYGLVMTLWDKFVRWFTVILDASNSEHHPITKGGSKLCWYDWW